MPTSMLTTSKNSGPKFSRRLQKTRVLRKVKLALSQLCDVQDLVVKVRLTPKRRWPEEVLFAALLLERAKHGLESEASAPKTS